MKIGNYSWILRKLWEKIGLKIYIMTVYRLKNLRKKIKLKADVSSSAFSNKTYNLYLEKVYLF